jgi:uncharacterized protein (UPF0179 family)
MNLAIKRDGSECTVYSIHVACHRVEQGRSYIITFINSTPAPLCCKFGSRGLEAVRLILVQIHHQIASVVSSTSRIL